MVTERNVLLAYILWFFLGNLGVHRFYTGRVGTGIVQILLSVVGWATVWLFIGWFFLAVLWLWLIVDIFLIPGMCRTPR
ncbi:TM2 domain-containing membrane protein YozV [Virgibacillus halotolerans]|uniref:TM2 domain-containing protein n=1 Tax=Virgibacillus halotolerans TaxID=1071053 RepID=UPI001960643B|nr:TM2 domain-containing protein [Virgibacillus halotolerans]MBM7599838.1 TM2 domain-containing membrane protein YozV [Virgibacillus halotolerans]